MSKTPAGQKSSADAHTLEPREAKKRRTEKVVTIAVVVLLGISTYLAFRLSILSPKLPLVNSIFFFGLINFNIIMLMVLVFLVSKNIGKLILERRSRILGSRLKTKLVLAFLSFTIIPTVLLFLISSLYINSSFDKWFSIKVQNTLQAALEITQTYYKNTSRVAQHLATQVARDLKKNHGLQGGQTKQLRKFLHQSLDSSAVDSIEVYTGPLEERELVKTSNEKLTEVPRLPLDILKKAFSGDAVSLVQHLSGADLIRAISPVMDASSGQVYAAVGVTFVIPSSLVNRVDEIASVFQDYREVNPLKYPVKRQYFILLIMITLLIIFFSIWIGLYIARELTVPLERLVKATKNVSQGNLDFEIINPGKDEIATLTSSFNVMTSEIKKHRRDLEDTNLKLKEKRAYVEAVIANIAAGVLSVDPNGMITTANPSAAEFLNYAVRDLEGKKLSDIFDPELVPLQELFERVQLRAQDGNFDPIQQQFSVIKDSEMLVLMAVASSFSGGVVVVIDDMSYLSKVQREAAWREVARRIAHEIKNPLTPIKLSAQRLQRKFASKQSSESHVFKECTDTIIRNVDELKDMVNEFSEFARFPAANPVPQNLNEVIREAVVLFEEAHRSIQFVYDSESRLPKVECDRDQIRRVIVNLLDNSVSALADGVGAKRSLPRVISVKTHYNEHLDIAVVEIEDNGRGMPESVKRQMFEPYFSTKTGGTGLGLAIVKRIISDHHGYIRVQSSLDEGCRFIIELPVNLIENEYVMDRQKKGNKNAPIDTRS